MRFDKILDSERSETREAKREGRSVAKIEKKRSGMFGYLMKSGVMKSGVNILSLNDSSKQVKRAVPHFRRKYKKQGIARSRTPRTETADNKIVTNWTPRSTQEPVQALLVRPYSVHHISRNSPRPIPVWRT